MSDAAAGFRQFQAGRLQGLREAAELLRGLEANVERRLNRECGRVTRDARRTRHKAHGVAAKRVETLIRKAERSSSIRGHFPQAMKELGLG